MTSSFIKRTRFEVMYEILSFCRSPRQKTHIMYKCNLSYEQLQKYIEFTVSSNLLKKSEENGKALYQITEHGENFIHEYEQLRLIIDRARKLQSSQVS